MSLSDTEDLVRHDTKRFADSARDHSFLTWAKNSQAKVYVYR